MNTISPDFSVRAATQRAQSPAPDAAQISPAHPSPDRDRALIIGGGGSTGNAWSIGILAGLIESGLDLTHSELVVGTSSGSTTAVQLLSTDPVALLEALIAPSPPHEPQTADQRSGDAHRRPQRSSTVNHLERTAAIIASAYDAADMRRKMGAGALELDAVSDGSWTSTWRATVAARLPRPEWPAQRLEITAVDARTGEPVVFDKESGVTLVDAVAASCSSGLPYRIGDELYIDGGYRRNENADLAAGHRRVLVLSPFGGRSRHPRTWGMDLVDQLAELRAAGSQVEALVPDENTESMFGADAMNPALRAPAARAGQQQGRSLATSLAEFWAA